MKSKELRLNMRVSQDEMNTLKAACELLDITMTELIRETALKTARAIIADGKKTSGVLSGPAVSTLSATADSQVNYFSTAIKLIKTGKDEVSNDT